MIPMKVVMVGPYPEPGGAVSGGVERVIDSLLPHLAERVDLTLVVPGAMSDSTSSKVGVDIHYLKRGLGPGVVRSSTFDAQKLATLIRSLKPDLVHLQASSSVGRFLNAPKIVTIHGIAHHDLLQSNRGGGWGKTMQKGAAALLKWTEHAARKQLDGVIVINPYVREALPDIKSLKQWDIPNPLDSRFISDLEPPSSNRPRRLISVGRITPRKETKRVIELSLNVMNHDPNVELTVCGTPSPAEYGDLCHQIVREHPAGHRVKFLGNLGVEDLLLQLDQASVLLMASSQETAPMAIAEANARGVAVVAPEAFGITHMITPGLNGRFLPLGDIEEQTQTVLGALDQDWQRSAIAAQAVAAYQPERIAEATVAAYRKVLARRLG
jgi:glycosyltransferase involved in cell wall biosynthesis